VRSPARTIGDADGASNAGAVCYGSGVPGARSSFELAQANVAYARFDLGDPRLDDYLAQLDAMNELADRSPGFVWRYLTDSRDVAQREFDDPRVLFNLSVWTSIEALHAYTYRTAHAEVYAGRRRWFVDAKAVVGGHALAMWWVPRGARPTVLEAKRRLALVTERGPTREAFTFKQRFPPTLSADDGP
jgi:heme-degrading monooxygenase HmoA